MKRLGNLLGVAALLMTALCFFGDAAGRFDQKLPIDKQIVHVLNRLTFGPRTGDNEQVRRLGVDKWIDQQLHPERITENPLLETKLKPLTTLLLPTWQLFEKYNAPAGLIVRPPSLNAINSLSVQQQSRLRNGSPEERLNTLNSLDANMRRLV